MARRIKRLRISGELLVAMFSEGNHTHSTVMGGLPLDARVVAWSSDTPSDVVTLFVESKSFPPVEEGPYPEFGPIAVRSHLCTGCIEDREMVKAL